jgi:hypothetical protein
MFRFAIRDVLLFMAIVGLGLAWHLEHRQSKQLKHEISVIENEVRQSRMVISHLYEDLDKIGQLLPHHGLALCWSNDMRPSIQIPPRSMPQDMSSTRRLLAPRVHHEEPPAGTRRSHAADG